MHIANLATAAGLLFTSENRKEEEKNESTKKEWQRVGLYPISCLLEVAKITHNREGTEAASPEYSLSCQQQQLGDFLSQSWCLCT